MAVSFTQQGGVALTFVYRDKSKNRGFSSLYLPSAVTIADARAFADALGAKIELASDAQIQGYGISSRATASGAAGPVAGGNVEHKGKMSLLTAAGKSSTFSIPAPKVAAMTSDERSLLVGDAIIDDIVTLLITGDGTVAPVDSNGSDLTALIETWVKHRASTIG